MRWSGRTLAWVGGFGTVGTGQYQATEFVCGLIWVWLEAVFTDEDAGRGTMLRCGCSKLRLIADEMTIMQLAVIDLAVSL